MLGTLIRLSTVAGFKPCTMKDPLNGAAVGYLHPISHSDIYIYIFFFFFFFFSERHDGVSEISKIDQHFRDNSYV